MGKIDIEQRESTPVNVSRKQMGTDLSFKNIDVIDQKRAAEEDIAVVQSMLEKDQAECAAA